MYRGLKNDIAKRRVDVMAKIEHMITRHLGVLSTSQKGWTKELNVVSWKGGRPKYDLRLWSPDHDNMSKGVTLNADEILRLAELLGGSVHDEHKSEFICQVPKGNLRTMPF